MNPPLYNESWSIRFAELGYCNCSCHNHADQATVQHVWGECSCYNPGKVYHDEGVLLAHPVRLLPFAEPVKPAGEIQASNILQSSFSRYPIPKSWYMQALTFLVKTFTPGRR